MKGKEVSVFEEDLGGWARKRSRNEHIGSGWEQKRQIDMEKDLVFEMNGLTRSFVGVFL